ncbi:MAG: 16S rRNA (cytosine(967)-C(5))-methyltransferase RsmB [Desulfobulbales bacterium]
MRTDKSSRRLAVLCLTRWDKEKQAIQPHIESIIYQSSVSSNDRHLAVMLINGVLRQMQSLDAIISRFSRFPLSRMKSLTLMALRIGVFQLIFLDRIPVSAAVNETVKVLKEEHQPRWIVNFVNGVLRSIAKNKTDISRPEEQDEKGTYIYNHPEWLVRRWQTAFGIEKTRTICQQNNKEPVLSLRINTLQTNPKQLAGLLQGQGYTVRQGRYAPQSLVVESFSGPVAILPGYEEGLFHVQDEAAQLVSLLLAPFEKENRYLDACAGLGGKTCHLAQLVDDQAELTAVEPNKHRFHLLEQNIMRLHLGRRVKLFQGGLENFTEIQPGWFHRILVDAPCSGTGVIGRHPDIRWNRKPEELPIYERKQLALLHHASSLLSPGGVLVYVTCSMEAEENQKVVESFLDIHPDFVNTNCRDFFSEPARKLVDSSGYFCSTPAEGLDGFFAARLVCGQ